MNPLYQAYVVQEYHKDRIAEAEKAALRRRTWTSAPARRRASWLNWLTGRLRLAHSQAESAIRSTSEIQLPVDQPPQAKANGC